MDRVLLRTRLLLVGPLFLFGHHIFFRGNFLNFTSANPSTTVVLARTSCEHSRLSLALVGKRVNDLHAVDEGLALLFVPRLSHPPVA